MGSTCFDWLSSSFSWDHPHIHGEHMISIRVNHGKEGSPPYTWGAHRELLKANGYREDHPHIHGEHVLIALPRNFAPGSPPYTWGAQIAQANELVEAGITPIYMGSTIRLFSSIAGP